MPVIGISVERLHALLRTSATPERIERMLDEIGCDVEGIVEMTRYKSRQSEYIVEVVPGESLPLTDPHSGFSGKTAAEVWQELGRERVVRLDLLPVRPDIFDAGGLARALRGYLGVETGLADYHAAGPQWRVEVDPRICDPRFGRPLIQCAVIRDISIDEATLRAIMKLQENLHWALCRDRKFASIGAYDLDKLASPVSYTLVDREEFRFTPLFWGQREPVSPRVMLEEHAKGVDYAHLVEGLELLPALLSANGAVLSLPPVINAEETKVTTQTTNLFLDVTGSNLPVVTRALNILATSIAELDPSGNARIEQVEMVFPGRVDHTPFLASERFEVHPERAARLIGVELSRGECVELLQKMRHGVDDPGGSGPLQVTVAAYRNDIMHEVDLIEDIAIAFGYHNVPPRLVPTFTAGRSIGLNDRSRSAAAALCGLGFTESLSLVLTSERDHYEKLRRETPARRARLANPISADQTMLRENLYSSLLSLLAANTDHPLPQKIFEAGDVVTYAGVTDTEQEPREERWIAGAICGGGAGYAAGRSALDALLHEMGHKIYQPDGVDSSKTIVNQSDEPALAEPEAENQPGQATGEAETKPSGVEYRPWDTPSALPGRSATVAQASVLVNSAPMLAESEESQAQRPAPPIAEVFEVHPQVLENFRLSNPVVLFALKLGDTEYGD